VLKVVIKTETPEWCLIRRFNEATILFKQIWFDEDGIKALVTFKTPNGNKTHVIRNHRCPLAECILNSGAIVVSAIVSKDEIVWNLACVDEEFKRLMLNLSKIDLECELIWKSSFFEEDDGLSYKELEILRLALNYGYFENPKGVRLEDIAKMLNISKATASDLLRRALKKVVKKFIDQI
jgi:predicted DNA binding protein